jgi:hypothetical protein
VVPTVAVRIVKAIPGSPDGVTVERYQVGQEVTLPEGLAAVFLREGWATLTMEADDGNAEEQDRVPAP